ncbi:MAG: hypothetical protein WDA47_03795 [Bacilli bacterium]
MKFGKVVRMVNKANRVRKDLSAMGSFGKMNRRVKNKAAGRVSFGLFRLLRKGGK